MMQRRILRAGIMIAIAAIVTADSSADARCRGRRACRTANRGCCQTASYGTNTTPVNNCNVNYAPLGNSCCSTQMQSGTSFDSTSGTAFGSNLPSSSPTYVGGSGQHYNGAGFDEVQNSGTQSVSKPVYDSQPNVNTQAVPVTPQPGANINEAAGNPAASTTGTPSSDPESDERKSLKIPGTAPTKAPAPAANAQP